jgi:hypothetical protein
MSAFHVPYQNSPWRPTEYGEWELVPRWHWRRLIGHDIRRKVHDREFHEGGWYWTYGNSRFVAHQVLEAMHYEGQGGH